MDKKTKGIFCILLSAFCFAWMNAFVRLAGDLPSIQKSFFRNFVAAIFAFLILKRDQIPFRWQKGNLKFLFLRSIAGTLGILCNFYAVDHLVLSDASMLNKMSPLFRSPVLLPLSKRTLHPSTGIRSDRSLYRQPFYHKTHLHQHGTSAVSDWISGRYGCRCSLYYGSSSGTARGKRSFYRLFLLCLFLSGNAALSDFPLPSHDLYTAGIFAPRRSGSGGRTI